MAKEVTKRSDNYSQWYDNLVVKADLAERSAVRGCMVIKPYGYAIWEKMQSVLDKMFNARLDTLRDSAAIRYNCRSYGKLNVGTFYTKLQTLRSQLQSASSGDTQS